MTLRQIKQLKDFIDKFVTYIILVIFGITMIFPFLWMLSTSLKEPSQVFTASLELLPKPFVFKNYLDAWKAIGAGTFLLFMPPELNIIIGLSPDVQGQVAMGLGQSMVLVGTFSTILTVGGWKVAGPIGALGVSVPCWGCTGFLYYLTYDYCLKNPDVW